jgi:adenylosuccinate synthase
LFVARKAHLILPTHRWLDLASESSKGSNKIGSTLRGIGPTYMDKTGRNGLRVGDIELKEFQDRYDQLKEKHLNLLKIYPDVSFDLAGEEAKWFESIEYLRQMNLIDAEYFMHDKIKAGNRILAEGAQGSMLDIDFGTYPFVTSSNTITAGVCTGLGISPHWIKEVIGISKAYCTRVGSGPFPTELHDETGEKLRKEGGEFGATTGRPRRCGWIDIPQLRYTCMINGVTQIVLTKLDVLDAFDELQACVGYGDSTELPYDLCATDVKPTFKSFKGWAKSTRESNNRSDLPKEALDYINFLSEAIGVPISIVSVGPGREQLLKYTI